MASTKIEEGSFVAPGTVLFQTEPHSVERRLSSIPEPLLQPEQALTVGQRMAELLSWLWRKQIFPSACRSHSRDVSQQLFAFFIDLSYGSNSHHPSMILKSAAYPHPSSTVQ